MELSRRGFLAGVGSGSLSLAGTADSERPPTSRRGSEAARRPPEAATTGQREPFDPGRHGFDFRNWSTLEGSYPEHEHERITPEQIRRTIKRDWVDPVDRLFDLDLTAVPEALVDAAVRQLYVAANQFAATNGHCYGMAFAAQQYYERPETLPLDADEAAAFDHPELPHESTEAPVAVDVDLYQNAQVLNPYAWVGRRHLFSPGSIDYEAQVETLVGLLDTFGTAGLTLLQRATRVSHQVLACGYERTPDGTRIDLYDPNYPASFYRRNPSYAAITVGDDRVVTPYEGYDAVVVNRWDRAVSARGVPDPGLTAGGTRAQINDVLGNVLLFSVDSPAVTLAAAGPADSPVGRVTGALVDTTPTPYSDVCYRYGAVSGRYRVSVVGDRGGTYTLEAVGARSSGGRIADRVTDSVAPGEVRTYAATLPKSGVGTIEPVAERGSEWGSSDWLSRLGLVGAGGVAGVAGLHLARRVYGDDDAPE